MITFDGTELVTTTYGPRFVKHESVGDRNLSTLPLAREDGEVLISEHYGPKTVRLQGVLKGSSQNDLEAKMDAFKELFSRPEKVLAIAFAGATREYVATCARHEFDRDHYHLSIVPWSAEFAVLSGEGRDSVTTTPADADEADISFDPATETYAETTFTLAGSRPPRPVATIVIPGANTVKGFEYRNMTTGERLVATYPGAWGAGDPDIDIEIDFEAKTVRGDMVDNVMKPMPFSGVFPRLAIGANNIGVRFGGLVNQKSHDDDTTEMTQDDSLTNTNKRFAQSFMVPSPDSTFQGVTLAIRKVASPGNLTFRIETDNNGAPSGTLVDAAATRSFSASTFGTSLAYVDLYTVAPFALAANTRYWIVISAASVDGSNRYHLGFLTPGSYPRGSARNSADAGSTWFDYSPKTDLMFRVRYGGAPESLTAEHTIEYRKLYL